jgi:uncharacterized protein YegL
LESVTHSIESALAGSYVDQSGGEIILITMQIDDSISMEGDKIANVIRGHNEIMDKMSKTPQGMRVLVQTPRLNGASINPFRPFIHAKHLSRENCQANGGTPLFEKTIVTLGTVLAKTEELVALGSQRVRSGTLLMTDGEAGDSTDSNKSMVASLVADMRQVGDHIVAGMGIGSADQYRPTFLSMGIPPELIFSANSRDEILEAFRMFGFTLLELTAGHDQAVQTFGQ